MLITRVAALKTEYGIPHIAGWSSLVARRAHNPKVVGSNPAPATKIKSLTCENGQGFFIAGEFFGPKKFTPQPVFKPSERGLEAVGKPVSRPLLSF